MGKPSDDQIREFLEKFPDSKQFTENELLYLHIPGFVLPGGIGPSPIDVLLCPMEHSGYQSRLYFAAQLTGLTEQRNWNGTVQVRGRSWHAFSWQTPTGLTMMQMMSTHVRALV